MKTATELAQQIADQELEACCKLLDGADIIPPDGAKTYPENLFAARERMAKLRAARRPKPPSLAEQAMAELQSHKTELRSLGKGFYSPAIDAALERLQQLEQENND